MTKKELREVFRQAVFKRDKNTCRVCGYKRLDTDLNAHHITGRHEMPNGGYVLSNGITVCEDVCHMKVEQFHITAGDYYDEGLHPNDLYKLIGSSYEQAYKDSEAL